MAGSRKPGPVGGDYDDEVSTHRGLGGGRPSGVMSAFEVPGPVGAEREFDGMDLRAQAPGPGQPVRPGIRLRHNGPNSIWRELQGRAALAHLGQSASGSAAAQVGQGRVPHRNPPAAVVELVGIERPGRPKKVELEANTAAAYERLVAHARTDGFAEPLFLIVSGYRSKEKQAELYAMALRKYKTEIEARRWVAPPGKSAHETGCAVDFWLGHACTKENNGAIKATDAYAWLREHANQHGFNPYEREGWHWEYYVG